MSVRPALIATLGALALAAAPAHAFTTSFAPYIGTTIGTAGLSIPSGDNTLSFSSPAAAGTFSVASTAGLYSFPAGLGDFSSFSGDTLQIGFAQPVSSVRLSFGLEDAFGLFGSDTLSITSDTGVTGTYGTGLDNLPLRQPEGVAQFNTAAPFSTLTITSANPFAIGSIATPEPMSLAVLSAGLFGLAAARRRR